MAALPGDGSPDRIDDQTRRLVLALTAVGASSRTLEHDGILRGGHHDQASNTSIAHSRALESRPDHRPEAAPQAQIHLAHPDPPRSGRL